MTKKLRKRRRSMTGNKMTPLNFPKQDKLIETIFKLSNFVEKSLPNYSCERDFFVRKISKKLIPKKPIILSFYEEDKWARNYQCRKDIPCIIGDLEYQNAPYGYPYISVRYMNLALGGKIESIRFTISPNLADKDYYDLGLLKIQWRYMEDHEYEALKSIYRNAYVKKKVLKFDPKHTISEHLLLAGAHGIDISITEKDFQGMNLLLERYTPLEKVRPEYDKCFCFEDKSKYYVTPEQLEYNPDHYQVYRFPDDEPVEA